MLQFAVAIRRSGRHNALKTSCKESEMESVQPWLDRFVEQADKKISQSSKD